jgi:hypothetical protein
MNYLKLRVGNLAVLSQTEPLLNTATESNSQHFILKLFSLLYKDAVTMNFVPKLYLCSCLLTFHRSHTIVKNYCRLLSERLSPDSTRHSLDVHY